MQGQTLLVCEGGKPPDCSAAQKPQHPVKAVSFLLPIRPSLGRSDATRKGSLTAALGGGLLSARLRNFTLLEHLAAAWTRAARWQGPTDFFVVVDETTFAVRDSHIRFISGVWLAMGMILALPAFKLSLLKEVVIACSIMIFIGGLLRFTQDDTTMLLSSRLLPSLIMGLVLFPLLAIWSYFGVTNRITTV